MLRAGPVDNRGGPRRAAVAPEVIGMRMRATVTSLDDHPNRTEILSVLAQLPQVEDRALVELAESWANGGRGGYVASARDRALSPDSPLVIDVLTAFEAVTALFADDVGGAAHAGVAPHVAVIALKAVRDAIAAVFARPVLTRAEYLALLRPWRQVYPTATIVEPDLGPQGNQLRSLLAALPRLATRCHDAAGQASFDALVERAWLSDYDRREAARECAWQAALITSRRRVWAMVRYSAAEAFGRRCARCGTTPDGADERRVLGLCLDAACALLVADAVPDEMVAELTAPLALLVPRPRRLAE